MRNRQNLEHELLGHNTRTLFRDKAALRCQHFVGCLQWLIKQSSMKCLYSLCLKYLFLRSSESLYACSNRRSASEQYWANFFPCGQYGMRPIIYPHCRSANDSRGHSVSGETFHWQTVISFLATISVFSRTLCLSSPGENMGLPRVESEAVEHILCMNTTAVGQEHHLQPPLSVSQSDKKPIQWSKGAINCFSQIPQELSTNFDPNSLIRHAFMALYSQFSLA